MIRTRSKKSALYVTFILLLMALRLFFWLSPEHQAKMIPAFLWPMAVAAAALLVWSCRAKLTRPAWAALGLAGWFGLTTLLNGDHYLEYNLQFLYGVVVTFGLCFPLLTVVKEPQKRLATVMLVYCLLMTGVSLLGLYACATGKLIHSPFSGSTINFSIFRLSFFDVYPNELASALSVAFFGWVLLAFKGRSPACKALCGLGALAVYAGVMLCVCKTAAIIVSLALGVSLYLIITALKPGFKARLPRILLGAAAGAAIAVFSCGVLLGQVFNLQTALQSGYKTLSGASSAPAASPALTADTASPVGQLEARQLTSELTNFTRRDEIWITALQYIQDRPLTLLIGSTDGQVARVPMSYQTDEPFHQREIYHMHNIWLEMLLLTGLPGLLAYLYLMAAAAVASVRLFFSKAAPAWQRFLGIITPMVLLNGLMEIYPGVSGNVMDMAAFILLGAVISMSRSLPKPLD